MSPAGGGGSGFTMPFQCFGTPRRGADSSHRVVVRRRATARPSSPRHGLRHGIEALENRLLLSAMPLSPSVVAAPAPNLAPHEPAGWSDSIVASTATGT